MGRARGLDIEIIEQPFAHPIEVIRRVSDSHPQLILAWAPYTRGTESHDRLQQQRIALITESGFEDALLLAAWYADDLADRLTSVTIPDIVVDAAPVTYRPADWIEFERELHRLESPHFVITPTARQQCGTAPYPDAGRMWEQLERLASAASAWAAANGVINGSLTRWIRDNFGIEVALFDKGLGAREFFWHDGKRYSRAPHVKVDDYKPPTECGRIYFAYVATEQRFIVDHIGLHL